MSDNQKIIRELLEQILLAPDCQVCSKNGTYYVKEVLVKDNICTEDLIYLRDKFSYFALGSGFVMTLLNGMINFSVGGKFE